MFSRVQVRKDSRPPQKTPQYPYQPHQFCQQSLEKRACRYPKAWQQSGYGMRVRQMR